MRRLALILALLALSGSCVASETAREQPATPVASDLADSAARSAASTDSSPAPLPLMARPEVVRGLYVNRWAALGERMWQLIDVAKRTEVNALVIDVKDDRGFMLYRSGVPLVRDIGADTNSPMSAKRLRAIIDTMRAHDIFPIARIVVAKDPLLALAKPEWAVKRKSDGTPWLDKNGLPWLDPHHREIWTYAGDIGDEAIALYLACLRQGAVFVPLNTAYTTAEVDYFLGDAEPKIADELSARARRAMDGLEVEVLHGGQRPYVLLIGLE